MIIVSPLQFRAKIMRIFIYTVKNQWPADQIYNIYIYVIIHKVYPDTDHVNTRCKQVVSPGQAQNTFP